MPSLPTSKLRGGSTTAKRMINARGLKKPTRAAATQEYPARRMKIVVEIIKAPYEIGVTRLFIARAKSPTHDYRERIPTNLIIGPHTPFTTHNSHFFLCA